MKTLDDMAGELSDDDLARAIRECLTWEKGGDVPDNAIIRKMFDVYERESIETYGSFSSSLHLSAVEKSVMREGSIRFLKVV